MMRTVLLFAATAVAEIVGCYAAHLWLQQGKSAWLVVPGALSLALFAWLLTLHPTAAGRTYACRLYEGGIPSVEVIAHVLELAAAEIE
jgi:small multidrug resistance family-3 protein